MGAGQSAVACFEQDTPAVSESTWRPPLDGNRACSVIPSCAGKSAYFQAGSLQLVVVPEPTGIAAGACGLGVMLVLRRRHVEGSPQKISKRSACDVAWLPNSHR